MQQNNNKALLVIDMQASIMGRLPDGATCLENVSTAIAAARSRSIPVIYVVVGFRQGMPEVSMTNKSFSQNKTQMAGLDMNEFMRIHERIAPLPTDPIVTKRRVSAFAGSDLEVLLRGLGVNHMVLTGVATSGAILSTTREASDKDYAITILSDCCADGDEEVHRVLTTKVFPRQADVMTAAEWGNGL
jgi:nicotinamidase-related amidase